jgi:ABC-type transporter Mla MlaB component
MGSRPQHTIGLAIDGPIGRADLPGLSERVSALLERNGPAVVVCDVGEAAADAVTVDALARLQLTARRHDCHLCLRRASAELTALIRFVGLADVLHDEPLQLERER